MDRQAVLGAIGKIDCIINDLFLYRYLNDDTEFEREVFERFTELSDKVDVIRDIVESKSTPRRLEARIRFVDLENDGEGFIFENKWSDEEEWGMDTLFNLIPQDDDPNHDLISYQALTKIRELQRMGIDVRFGK